MADQPLLIMFDFYTRFYQAVVSSAANAEYCARVYGRNLCQHGFADLPHLDHLIQVSGINAGSRVLDLGCGNGMIAEYISDLTGAHVTGIDFIPQAIHDATERTESKRERLVFQVMQIDSLKFPPASFDVMVSVDTFYFTNLNDTLRGCLPLLSQDGCLVAFFDQSCGPETPIETYPSEITLPNNTELAQALVESGFVYQYWDYSNAMLAHLQRRVPVLADLKAQFEAEGNLFLYESHLGEALAISHAYTHNAGKRYLYLASQAESE